MYRITEKLATAELGISDYEELYQKFFDQGWYLIDVRDMADDGTNEPRIYRNKIEEAVELMKMKCQVVIGCHAGQSRSNAIALGVLVRYYDKDFYDAWELVKEKVPIAEIDPSHIAKLKKLFSVTLP